LPGTPFAIKDANIDSASEHGSLSTWKKKVTWQFKSRQKRADAPIQLDTGVFDLSQVQQNVQRQPLQQAHSNTATVCESLDAKTMPLSSTSSSASCDTPSDSDVESLTSNATDALDFETCQAEVVPEQKVTELKQNIVDRIMKDFCSTFYRSQGIRVCPGDRGNDCNGDRSSRNACDHAASTPGHIVQAFLQGAEGQRGRSGDGEDNDGNRDQRSSFNTPAEASDEQLLACPFYKRDPLIHANIRSCCGPGWSTIARVK